MLLLSCVGWQQGQRPAHQLQGAEDGVEHVSLCAEQSPRAPGDGEGGADGQGGQGDSRWMGQGQLDEGLVWACCLLMLRACGANGEDARDARGRGRSGGLYGWKTRDAAVVGRVLSSHRRILPAVLARLTDVCLGHGGGGAESKGAGCGGGGAPLALLSPLPAAEHGAEALEALLSDGSVRMLLARGGGGFRTLQASLARLKSAEGLKSAEEAGRSGGRKEGGSLEGSQGRLSRGAHERLESQYAMISAVVEAQKLRAGR